MPTAYFYGASVENQGGMLSRRAGDSCAAIGASSGHLAPLEWQEGKNTPAQLQCGHAYNLADEGPVNRLWDSLKAASIGEPQTGGSPNTRHVSMFRGNMSAFGVCGKPGSPRRAVAAPPSLVITISTRLVAVCTSRRRVPFVPVRFRRLTEVSNIDTYLRLLFLKLGHILAIFICGTSSRPLRLELK